MGISLDNSNPNKSEKVFSIVGLDMFAKRPEKNS